MRLRAEPTGAPLGGSLRPPGDKSISHRALILAGLAAGPSRLVGLLTSADTLATQGAMRQLGAGFAAITNGLEVRGVGDHGLTPPATPLNMGNSGTAMRLLAGVLAAQPFDSVLTGDASLSARPMGRIMRPLELMGARIKAAPGDRPPLEIFGNPRLRGIEYHAPVSSAQVKSCLLLAGLYASGRTLVREPAPSRDHTERMLPLFGVPVEAVSVEGGSRLQGARIEVPADPSSAAFFLAAASLVPRSELVLSEICMNPARTGFLRALEAMGGEVRAGNERMLGREPVADLQVRWKGRLRGIDVPADWVPSLIDEFPVLIAMAANAEGVTRIRGAAELRVKESDRLAVMGRGLTAMGIVCRELPDGMDIVGGQPQPARVDAAGDHRCAMAFAVLGQVVRGGLEIAGAGMIDTSYPEFTAHLRRVGGHVQEARA